MTITNTRQVMINNLHIYMTIINIIKSSEDVNEGSQKRLDTRHSLNVKM